MSQTVEGLFTTEPDFQSELSKVSVPRREEYPTQKLTPQIRQKERSRTLGKERQSYYSGEHLGKKNRFLCLNDREMFLKRNSYWSSPDLGISWVGTMIEGGKNGAVIR